MKAYLSCVSKLSVGVIALVAMSVMSVSVPRAAYAAAGTAQPSAASKCVVHAVQVGGTRPNVTCLKWVTSGASIYSNVSEDRCSGSQTYKLEVDDYYYGAYCFWGGGYLGLGDPGGLGDIYHTSAVRSLCTWYNNSSGACENWGSGWVMAYWGGSGHRFYWGNGTTYDCSNSLFCGNIDVTQVYLN